MEKGLVPEVVDYMKEPLTPVELSEVIKKLGITASDLIRKKEKIWKEEFSDKELTDEELVLTMIENPRLMERPILVNGATGGVGSFAIAMLSSLGFEVTALTGKPQSSAYLRGLGATEILLRGDVEMGERPLEKTLWGGAVDSVGGNELGWLTRTVRPLGNIASIGLAGGHTLSTTVMPFILRGINLLGINSVLIPRALKLKILQRLAGDLKPENLALIVSREVTLEQLDGIFQDYLDGSVTGRTVVKIS